MPKLNLTLMERKQLRFLLEQNILKVEDDMLKELDAGRKTVASLLLMGIAEMTELRDKLLIES